MRRLPIAFLLVSSVLPGPASAAPGAAWVPSLQATQGIDKLSIFPDGVAYAQHGDSYVRSTDFGLTWQRMAPPPHAAPGGPGIRFATPSVGYSLGGGGLIDPGRTADELLACGTFTSFYRTADAGASWSPVCMPPASFDPASSPLVVWRDGRTLLLAGTETRSGGTGCPAGVVYSSTTAGARWTRGVLPAGYFPAYRMQFLDARTAALIAYRYPSGGCDGLSDRNAVLVTRDGGRTWTRVLACDAQPLCTSVAFASASRLVVGRTDGSLMVSRDGGRRWVRGQRLSSPANDRSPYGPWAFWAQSIGFADDRHGFASTRGAGTWRTADGGVSWTQERSHECAYHPFGIGEIAVATPERALTGGPLSISARVPVAESLGGCGAPVGDGAAPSESVSRFRRDGSLLID